MASYQDLTEFEESNKKPAACVVCEAMLLEAVDGTLTEAEQRMFDAHVAGCSACSRELGEAQRGAAWLAMLKGHQPQPTPMLLQRILAETTGAYATDSHVSRARHGAPANLAANAGAPRLDSETWASSGNTVISNPFAASFAAWRRRVAASFSFEGISQPFQPRLAMTASMAFLSIALTLNIVGVRLSDVAHTLSQPSSLRRTAANAGASARRNFQGLRVVNVVESRVSDLRSNDELGRFSRDNNDQGEPASSVPSRSKQADPANGSGDAPRNQQQKKEPQKVPQGSSELLAPPVLKNEIQKEVQS